MYNLGQAIEHDIWIIMKYGNAYDSTAKRK